MNNIDAIIIRTQKNEIVWNRLNGSYTFEKNGNVLKVTCGPSIISMTSNGEPVVLQWDESFALCNAITNQYLACQCSEVELEKYL